MISYKFNGRALLGVAALAVGSMQALAEPGSEAATEQVKASLIASASAVHPGDEILIGVHQSIIPHWHTYWKNPGDSGLPTRIQYELPSGSAVSDIQWPTPSKIVMGPVVNYGYHDAVTLLSTLRVADDAEVGGELPIRARVKWLVCEQTCIPQQVELALRMPVVAKGATVEAGSPLIEPAKAQLPTSLPWQAALSEDTDGVSLHLTGSGLESLRGQDIRFFPEQWGPIAHAGEQVVVFSDRAVELHLKPGDRRLTPGQTLAGILAVGAEDAARGYRVDVALSGASDPPAPVSADLALPTALLLALAGGLILNLMPCVFPVLSIKALGLLQQAGHAPWRTRLHGWAYTAGVLLSFAVLAGILIVLKAGGASIGWGFQFQSPLFVLCLAYLMFAVGLSLSGVFSIGASITGIGSGLAARGGYSGSFFSGVLAAVVATPCTAPFMGAAIGFALSQSGLVMLAVFLSLGAGLALPYWLLSHWPALQRSLPKPGLWMETLKQGLAFSMYAAAAWLVWVLAQQAGATAVAGALAGFVAIAFVAWLYQVSRTSAGPAGPIAKSAAASLLVATFAGSYFTVDVPSDEPRQTEITGNTWQAYSAERLSQLRAEGKPVFVNFTAAWCISCLVNERVALGRDSVAQAFRDGGVVYLKGDWTNRDAEIEGVLKAYGRSGVPLYLYFAPGADTAAVLPQILTPDIVISAVSGGSIL
ncbi:MAG: protein-disulfide reductase DsbD family protein [Methylomonas sp.]